MPDAKPAGTLNAYYRRHRKAGFKALAEKAGTTMGYLYQLNYVPTKKPSLAMAKRLVEASNGEITYEGLDNPRKVLLRCDCERCREAI